MSQEQESRDNGAHAEHYSAAALRLKTLWTEMPGRDETLRQVVAILHQEIPHYHWVGIYLLEDEELVLHNFLGRPTPHERIPMGKGICGAAVQDNETIVVDDVKSDSRYLACSLETASEVVVPIRIGQRPVGEIDIDSDDVGAFDGTDRAFLENLARQLTPVLADALDTIPPG